MGGFFLLQVAVRLLSSAQAGLDESEQLVFTQAFCLGYGPQPPLYTWLQMAVFKLTGPNLLGLALLKNALLFATYALTYVSARFLTRSHAAGVVAAVSLLFIPQISWESERELTHTVLATLLAATTLCILLRLYLGGGRAWYGLLGLVLGGGILAKYNYAFVPAGLFAAAMLVKEFRRIVLDRGMLLALLVAGAIVLPHALWLRANLPVVFSASHKIHPVGNMALPILALRAAMRVTSGFLLSMAGIVAVFAILCRRELLQHGTSIWREPRAKFFVSTIATALLFVLGVMLVSRTVGFRGRWLQPLWCCVPVLLAIIVGPQLTRSIVRRLLAVGVAVATSVTVLLPARGHFVPYAESHHLNAPFRALAQQLAPLSKDAELIIAGDRVTGGNLRMLCPEKLILTPAFTNAPRGLKRYVGVFDATRRKNPLESWDRVVWQFDPGRQTAADLRYLEAQRSGYHQAMRFGVITGPRPSAN